MTPAATAAASRFLLNSNAISIPPIIIDLSLMQFDTKLHIHGSCRRRAPLFPLTHAEQSLCQAYARFATACIDWKFLRDIVRCGIVFTHARPVFVQTACNFAPKWFRQSVKIPAERDPPLSTRIALTFPSHLSSSCLSWVQEWHVPLYRRFVTCQQYRKRHTRNRVKPTKLTIHKPSIPWVLMWAMI